MTSSTHPPPTPTLLWSRGRPLCATLAPHCHRPAPHRTGPDRTGTDPHSWPSPRARSMDFYASRCCGSRTSTRWRSPVGGQMFKMFKVVLLMAFSLRFTQIRWQSFGFSLARRNVFNPRSCRLSSSQSNSERQKNSLLTSDGVWIIKCGDFSSEKPDLFIFIWRERHKKNSFGSCVVHALQHLMSFNL